MHFNLLGVWTRKTTPKYAVAFSDTFVSEQKVEVAIRLYVLLRDNPNLNRIRPRCIDMFFPPVSPADPSVLRRWQLLRHEGVLVTDLAVGGDVRVGGGEVDEGKVDAFPAGQLDPPRAGEWPLPSLLRNEVRQETEAVTDRQELVDVALRGHDRQDWNRRNNGDTVERSRSETEVYHETEI